MDAFGQLGLEVTIPDGESSDAIGLVLDEGGTALLLQLERRSLVTDDIARRLLSTRHTSRTLFVVADRVTDAARKLLTAHIGGYLDLRGHLALRAPGVLIDADVQPVNERATRAQALGGKAGLEVASALLIQPHAQASVRELARQLGRSPSTVSDILASLRTDGLIDAQNIVTGTELFWQLADRWANPKTYLTMTPQTGQASLTRPLRLGLDDVEHKTGWALTDTAAAVAYGAPLAVRSDQLLDFLVPDLSTLQRAKTLLGSAVSAREARASVRVAPVPAAVRHRVDLDVNVLEWPLTHPLFVALDLAQDAGRGREILDAWRPDGRWARVW